MSTTSTPDAVSDSRSAPASSGLEGRTSYPTATRFGFRNVAYARPIFRTRSAFSSSGILPRMSYALNEARWLGGMRISFEERDPFYFAAEPFVPASRSRRVDPTRVEDRGGRSPSPPDEHRGARPDGRVEVAWGRRVRLGG